MTDNSNAIHQTNAGANGSTLIEFPGVNRNRPAWRKELSERFREIQQRRAREAALEEGADLRQPEARGVEERPDEPSAQPRRAAESTKQLGLVPTPDEPAMNPIVVAALRRIERARKQDAAHTSAHRSGSARTHAATAAARVVEEQPETYNRELTHAELTHAPVAAAPPPKAEAATVAADKAEPAQKSETVETTRAAGLVAVSQTQPAKAETKEAHAKASAPAVEKVAEEKVHAPSKVGVAAPTVAAASQPRKVAGVIDDHWLERHEAEILPKVAAAAYDDRAPLFERVTAAVVDLLVVAFLSSPFAAAIELTIGDWGDPRVIGSMAGIVCVLMFLYHACAVALAGRTWGMSLFSLHAVDAATAHVPTTWQCARRAVVYMLSLATFGLGILYALFDAEGRTAHDLLSGTVVVRE